MMDNRKKTGLLIIFVAILILIIIAILFFKKINPAPSEPTPTNVGIIQKNLDVAKNTVTPTSTPGDRQRNYQTYDISKEEPHKVNSNDAVQTAKLFATRFGSFSNQSDYGNVMDLKIFMTDSMKTWADKYVANLKAQEYTGEYYGIITYPLITKVLSYDDQAGKAKVEVTTERQESKGEALSSTYQQKMILDLIKSNNEWLVDNAVWQK